MNEGEVIAVKDNGKKQRWAVGRWFYKKEGLKDKVNHTALSWIVGGTFLVALISGLLRDTQVSPSLSDSKISPPDQVSGQGESIDIGWAEEGPATESEKERKVRPSRNLGSFLGLQKIERQDTLDIPPGTMVRAKLSSGASDGPTRAVLVEDLVVNGSSSAKAGSILVGKGVSGEERLLIHFTHLVFKDGKSQRIDAQACDVSDKMPGLKGSNIRGKSLKIGGAVGLGLIAGTAAGYQTRQNQLSQNTQPTMQDALLQGVATASLEQARSLTSNIQNTKAKYEVENQTEFYVLFAGDGS